MQKKRLSAPRRGSLQGGCAQGLPPLEPLRTRTASAALYPNFSGAAFLRHSRFPASLLQE